MMNGATDFVHKPTRLASAELAEVGQELVAKVRTAASYFKKPLLSVHDPSTNLPDVAFPPRGKVRAVVIGVSTGGPQALNKIIPYLPAEFPFPICLVLHMPVGFTGPLAERLDRCSKLRVVEAGSSTVLEPGLCVVGKAGQQFEVVKLDDERFLARASRPSREMLHTPSIDVLFESAAKAYGRGLLALVLTGMGTDGLAGAAWVKSESGHVYVQSKETCVVHGMPRAVEESGLSDGSLDVEEILPFLLKIAEQ
jgi:two-component system chemotaxis response regulator CheB